jgi:hypothetical protein
MARKKKQRKKKKENQDASAADGGMLSVRRNMAHATGARDNSMRKIWIIGIALVALAFLLLVFTP